MKLNLIDWTLPIRTHDGRLAEDRGTIQSYEGPQHLVVITEHDGKQSLRRVTDTGWAIFAENNAAYAHDRIVNVADGSAWRIVESQEWALKTILGWRERDRNDLGEVLAWIEKIASDVLAATSQARDLTAGKPARGRG